MHRGVLLCEWTDGLILNVQPCILNYNTRWEDKVEIEAYSCSESKPFPHLETK